jgi:hypothetical protein
VAGIATPGVVRHAGDTLALDGVKDVARELRAVGRTHLELGHVVHERIGAEVTGHDHQLMRGAGPIGHQKRGGDREHTHVPSLALFEVPAELGVLFDSQVEREVHEDIGVGDGAFEDGRHPPLVLLHDLVDPHDRAVGAPRSADGLDPAHRCGVHMVGTTISTVDMRPNKNLHARLDLGIVIHQLDQRIHRRLGNS